MVSVKRRDFLAAGAAAILAAPAIAQSSRQRVLRLVPQADLSSLDPVWRPAAVTTNHAYAIFDTLYAVNEQLQVRPQMAEGHDVSDDQRTWTIRLRAGLRFHDAEPVRARDCVASLIRWAKRDTFGQLVAKSVDAWEAPDDRTIRVKLKRPFPRLLVGLAKPSGAPFMMPERLARNEPETQITEMIGSGPYRFLKDEWSVGNRVAYARNEAYQPRDEPPDLFSGGKRAMFDRIEWHVIPDPSTATGALLRGEVDWLEQTSSDLNPMISSAKSVFLEDTDSFGLISFLRFNTVVPPFNNGRLRQALLGAINQSDYMQAVTADNLKWRECASMFPCGMPFSTELGKRHLSKTPDFAKVRAAVQAAGYAGERVVILKPSDFAAIAPLADVAADAFSKAGLQVDLQTMDWGTLVQRRASKAPVDAGGWSVWPAWASAIEMINPAFNNYIRGIGPTGFSGWYENEAIERLVQTWLDGGGDQDQQAIYDGIQAEAWAAPPTIMCGQYFPTTAYASDLTGRIRSNTPLFWNIRRS